MLSKQNKVIKRYSEIRCIVLHVLQTSGFFCSVNHFSEGRVNANHNVTCLPSLAENDSGLLKNSEDSKGNHYGKWIFRQGKEADIASFLQVTRIRKIRKICEAILTS